MGVTGSIYVLTRCSFFLLPWKMDAANVLGKTYIFLVSIAHSRDETCFRCLFIVYIRLFRDASLSIMIVTMIMTFPPSFSEVVLFASLFVSGNDLNILILYIKQRVFTPWRSHADVIDSIRRLAWSGRVLGLRWGKVTLVGVMLRRFCIPSGPSVAEEAQESMHVVLDTGRSTDVRQIDALLSSWPPIAPPRMSRICPGDVTPYYIRAYLHM